MKVGIAYDVAPTDPALLEGGPDDRFEEFDKFETVMAITGVIEGEGHEVVLLGDGREFLSRILDDPPDFVFNIAEGEGIGRCRESRVPAVLEMLGIPHSGSDPLTLGLCLDKEMARHVLKPLSGPKDHPYGFEVPWGWLLPPEISIGDELIDWIYSGSPRFSRSGPLDEPPPLILKPALEGSSKGIRGRCVAEYREEAFSIYRRLASLYCQPILIEEFIAGDEVTVGCCGTHRRHGGLGIEVLGIMQVVPRQPAGRFVYSLEVKRNWRDLVDYRCPATSDPELIQRLSGVATTIYEALGCLDFARIDFRVRDSVPYFIEANPLPGLAPGTSDLVILAEGHGIGYSDLIRRIFHASLTRVGLL